MRSCGLPCKTRICCKAPCSIGWFTLTGSNAGALKRNSASATIPSTIAG